MDIIVYYIIYKSIFQEVLTRFYNYDIITFVSINFYTED